MKLTALKNNKTKNARGGAPQGEPIRLEFTHSTASTVCAAGSFNDWRPEATPMIPWGDGRWLKELVLPPGTYEYRLVVDGEWMADPLAKERVPNPFGGMNSVVKVGQCA